MFNSGKGNFVRVALDVVEPVKKLKYIHSDNMWSEYENKPLSVYFSAYKNLNKINQDEGPLYLTLRDNIGKFKDLSPIMALEAHYVGISISGMEHLEIDTKRNRFSTDSYNLDLNKFFEFIEMDIPEDKSYIALPLGVILDKLKIKARASDKGVILETEDKSLLGNPLYMVPAMLASEIISCNIAKQCVDIICDNDSASDLMREELQKSIKNNDESGKLWMDMIDDKTVEMAVDAMKNIDVIFHI